MICPSCGAKIDGDSPKCPYCETINLPGAQQAYMDKLEDIREDMEQLKDMPGQETKRALKHQGKKLLVIVGVLIVIVGALWLLITASERGDSQAQRQEVLWLQEHKLQWDEWYEEEQYDLLIEAYRQELDKKAPVWCWNHYDFLSLMVYNIAGAEEYLEAEKEKPLSASQLVDLFYQQVKIYQSITDKYALDETERKRVMQIGARCLEDLYVRWNLTEDSLGDLLRENGGYMSMQACEEFVRSFKK